MDTTVKSSVSIQKSLWVRLNKYKNRSGLINKALELYFEREQFLEKADKEYWEMVDKSLRAKDGEYITLNPNGEEITEELLEKKLWN